MRSRLISETSHAQPVPGRVDERFDNPLERLRLLAGDDDAIASSLDELDVQPPREMLAELARRGPLAHPDRLATCPLRRERARRDHALA